MRIVVVCSANRCRSPMGAALLQLRLAGLGVDAHVTSAGFGPPDRAADRGAVEAMAEVGIDLGGHRSRTVSLEECGPADLIIGMTRDHVMGVATTVAGAWPHTFPLVDLVRRGGQMGPGIDGEQIRTWVRRAHGERTAASVLALPGGDDITDPTGQPLRAYRRTREQLTGLTGELARLLAGPASVGDA